MSETWKDISGFEGIYQISDMGNVKSLSWRNTGQARNLVPKITNRGYAHVHLYKNGAKRDFTIHRLVATHFIENKKNHPLINHKDENPLNNRADNLEWCDQSYNMRYYFQRHNVERRSSGSYRKSREKGISYKPTQKIEQRTRNGSLVKIWDSFVRIKYALNKNESSIRDCCTGKRKQAYGYQWAFVHEDMLRENAG